MMNLHVFKTTSLLHFSKLIELYINSLSFFCVSQQVTLSLVATSNSEISFDLRLTKLHKTVMTSLNPAGSLFKSNQIVNCIYMQTETAASFESMYNWADYISLQACLLYPGQPHSTQYQVSAGPIAVTAYYIASCIAYSPLPRASATQSLLSSTVNSTRSPSQGCQEAGPTGLQSQIYYQLLTIKQLQA